MTSRGSAAAAPAPVTISVLAVSSLQVILLVLVGSTAFFLSIVSNLLPSRAIPARRAVSPRAPSPASRASRRVSHSASTASSRKLLPPLVVEGDTGSLPALSISSLDSTDDESELETPPTEPITTVSPTSVNGDKPFEQRRVSLSTPAARSPTRCEGSRRSSLDVVRHTLHIPPRSPPSSCASSLASDDNNRQACRPKLARIFSSHRESKSSLDTELLSSPERIKPLRRMSIKLSGLRSRGRRAISEVDSDTPELADLLVSAEPAPQSPPGSPTLKALTSPTKSIFRASSATKPKLHSRRTASDYTAGGSLALDRHQIMAEARKDMEREATLAALNRNAVDMAGHSEQLTSRRFH